MALKKKKVSSIGNSLFKRTSAYIWSKKAELGSRVLPEVITPGKKKPYKCCLCSSNISMEKDFDMDVLFIKVVIFSVMFIEYGQNVNKHDIS